MSATNNLFYSFCVSPEEWIVFDPDDDKFRACEYECWGDDDNEIFVPEEWALYDDKYNEEKNNNVVDDGDDDRKDDDDEFASFHTPGDNVDANGDVKNCLGEYYRYRYALTWNNKRRQRKKSKESYRREIKTTKRVCYSSEIQIHSYVKLDRQRLKRIEPPNVSLTYWSVYANYNRKDIQHINAHIH
eukprot:CAMPEP_0113502944 /NCGR_PEP_ID=MMETSP0014_2-20120614/33861_1 /TAXON_ID=2857 /ORGANISM="Nitzschia sp." /LENGTH=186 /DNA_ID=CAMNT_0000397839 /DNA_START=286 /DNA_END=843 /DNA_ORIENTATION=+ /assembly_acc=CAM_ASM_000159